MTIRRGSWVKIVMEGTVVSDRLEAIGVVAGRRLGRDPACRVHIVCQTVHQHPSGGSWRLDDNYICPMSRVAEISTADAVLFILKNGGQNDGL